MSQRQRGREDQPPNYAASALGGLIFGMLGGLACAGWDVAVLGWFGAGAPHGPGLGLSVVLFAISGAVLGVISGFGGLSSGKWSLAMAILTVGWLLSGKVAGWMEQASMPGLFGTLFVLLPMFAAGQLVARFPLPSWVLHGASVTLMAWVALCVPLNLHVLPTSADGLAMTVGLLCFAVALFFGVVAAILAREDGPPLIPIVLAALVGWGAAWPVLDNQRPWPVGEGDRPAVVLIVVDGLRTDRVSYAGYQRKTTPNLDKFARGAFFYENATATSPWTIPAMASLLTGRLPYRHGAGIHDGNRPRDSALRADTVTIADLLRREGYATAAVTGDMWLDNYGLDSGFDRWSDDAGWGAMSSSAHPLAMMGLGAMGWPLSRGATAVTDDALSFVEAQETGDWFLMVQYHDLRPPFPYDQASLEALGKSTRAYPDDEYDAALHTVDVQIGRLIDELPAGAWIVVAGDHGTELTEDRERTTGVPYLARSGHGMSQELLHVPLFVRAPGKQGRRVARLVSAVDLAPTLLKGLKLPGFRAPEGVPLYEIVGGDKPQEGLAVVSQCVQFGPEKQAVRVGDNKLVQHAFGKTPLYNLRDDPDEVHPLRAGDPRNDQLEKRLGAALPPAGAGVSYGEGVPLAARLGVFATKIGR